MCVKEVLCVPEGNVLSKAFPIDTFDKAKNIVNKKKVKAEI